MGDEDFHLKDYYDELDVMSSDETIQDDDVLEHSVEETVNPLRHESEEKVEPMHASRLKGHYSVSYPSRWVKHDNVGFDDDEDDGDDEVKTNLEKTFL